MNHSDSLISREPSSIYLNQAAAPVQVEQTNMLPSDFFSRKVQKDLPKAENRAPLTSTKRTSPREISLNEGDLINPHPELSRAIQSYLQGETFLDSIPINEFNYQTVLNAAKYVDLMNDRLDRQTREEMRLWNTTYELRTLCLQASRGKMQSFEAYTKSMNPKYFENPFSAISRAYAACSDHYVPERVALHAMVLRQYTIEIHALASRYGRAERSTIYALRGNTATGKTYSAKNDAKCRRGLDENGEMIGALATDRVKGLLRRGVDSVTNQQIHIEGAELNGRITSELKQKAVHSTMIVDETLKFPANIESLIQDAQNSNKILVVKDLDAPLAISALRVLTRDVNIEPCTPIGPIESGLLEIRKNRKDVINRVLDSSTVGQYELHVMDQTGRTGLAACKQMEGDQAVLKIVDEELFHAAMGGEKSAQEEILNLKGKTVGELAERFSGKVNAEKLKPYWNLRIDEALVRHSEISPKWSKKTAS